MSWTVSDQEYDAVTALPDERRYAYFIKKVADWEVLWSLRSQDG